MTVYATTLPSFQDSALDMDIVWREMDTTQVALDLENLKKKKIVKIMNYLKKKGYKYELHYKM